MIGCRSMRCKDAQIVIFAAMEIRIRRAESPDVPQMLALVKELAVFEKEPEAVTVTLEHMTEAGFGSDPVWVGWVAELGTEIIGLAICYERYSTWKGRRLYLEDIVVTERARGQRIGERLFRECARHAVSMNYAGMLWQVLDWNVDAIRFYKRFGAATDPQWINGSLDLDQLKEIAAE
jgi:ribosomal protein S18 acetylase RimI-like enzyme